MDAINHIQLTILPNQVKPVLQALLYAIFFHRTLDNIEPETLEVCDTHIACAPGGGVEKEVKVKIEEFGREYLETGQERGEIAVVFLQRRPRKGWFAVTEELIPWEEHLITLHFPRRPQSNRNNISTDLTGALTQLLIFCSDKKGNVPPLTNESGQNNLSHQILINPPPPSELFSPSPPTAPTRLTSPPPPALSTTTVTYASHDSRRGSATSGPTNTGGGGGNGGVGAAMGYLESVKDGVRAVGVGVSRGWTGRGGFGIGG